MNKVEFKNVLIVEDGDNLRESLAAYFSERNKVTACKNLKEAVAAANGNEYDIVLLDLILPDGNGKELIKFFTQSPPPPIIILSDLGTDENIIDGFSAGAADYIVKPASIPLIETRMALRLLPNSKAAIKLGGMTLNVNNRTAFYDGRTLDLTSSEFNILMFLMQHKGAFFTANEIYEQVWKMPHLNTATIKMHLSNLRKKLLAVSDECAALLVTKFGNGYAFVGGDK